MEEITVLDYYIIVIGASAGGLTPLKVILSSLPKNFPAAVFVVKHISPSTKSLLPEILSKISKLPVIHPENNQIIQPGHIYVAPPKLHMNISKGNIQLKKGPRVNHSIPAIDPLFYSAALYNKTRTIGILLSGLLDDGSAGMLAIKKCHGISIVQDLDEAEYPDMPANSLKAATIDHCLPASKIGTLLNTLISPDLIKPHTLEIPDVTLLEYELSMDFTETNADEKDMTKIASPSIFSCPECNGVLWKINDNSLERYRCRVGHAYGLNTLISNKEKNTDAALWAALRALEEKRNLAKNVVERAQQDNSGNLQYFQNKSEELEKHIVAIRNILNQ